MGWEKRGKQYVSSVGRVLSGWGGRRKGLSFNSISDKKVKKNKTLSVIADEVEEAEDTIQDIYEMVRQNLEKSVKEIYLLIHNEKQ